MYLLLIKSMRKPQKLPLEILYNNLPNDIKQNKKIVSFRDGIGVAIMIDGNLFRNLKLTSSPYLLEDYRMGVILQGQLRGYINLQEYTMQKNTIVFVTPGTIVEPIDVSDDFLMEGIGLPADKFLLAHNGKLPELFNGRICEGRKTINAEDISIIDYMLRLLQELLERGNTSKEVIYGLIKSISCYYDQMFQTISINSISTHSSVIFNRFLRLVNLYGKREHQLAFYSDKLCITSRYLSTLVQSTSGVGAKEWIDRAVVSQAKVLLRHSDKQTAQIADELNFPNASFFCKYFKRITGLTPQQYRNEEINL